MMEKVLTPTVEQIKEHFKIGPEFKQAQLMIGRWFLYNPEAINVKQFQGNTHLQVWGRLTGTGDPKFFTIWTGQDGWIYRYNDIVEKYIRFDSVLFDKK